MSSIGLSLSAVANRLSGSLTPGHSTSHRPLVLLGPANTRVSIDVPSSAQEWIAAEVGRESFAEWLAAEESNLPGFEVVELDEDNDSAADEDAREKQLVLICYFLQHLTKLLAFPSGTSPATAQVVLAVYVHLSANFVDPNDAHSIAASLTGPIRNLLISSYYAARTSLELAGLGDQLPERSVSGLLAEASSGSAEVYALFGGQGMNEVYFDELQSLYDLYSPLLAPFLSSASSHLVNLAAAEQSTQLYSSSLDAFSWLESPSTRPSVPYLASCAVSLPLIGLTQLAQYVVFGKASGLGPAELGAKFKGATGHSQGVVSACVIAAEYAAQAAAAAPTLSRPAIAPPPPPSTTAD